MPAIVPIDTNSREFRPEPITPEEGGAMFRAVVNMFHRWNINDDQAAKLLDLPLRTYRRWKLGEIGRIDRDKAARLSNLLGVHKALRLIFQEPERVYSWVKAPNDAFSGRTALDVMLDGDLTSIMRVRRYLDAERGAW